MAGPLRAELDGDLLRRLPYETGVFRFNDDLLRQVQAELGKFGVNDVTPSGIHIARLRYPKAANLNPQKAIQMAGLNRFPFPILVAQAENVYPDPLMVLSLNPNPQTNRFARFLLFLENAVRSSKVQALPLPPISVAEDGKIRFDLSWLTTHDIPDGLTISEDMYWPIGPLKHFKFTHRLIIAVTPSEAVMTHILHENESLIQTAPLPPYQLPPELMPKPAPAAPEPVQQAPTVLFSYNRTGERTYTGGGVHINRGKKGDERRSEVARFERRSNPALMAKLERRREKKKKAKRGPAFQITT